MQSNTTKPVRTISHVLFIDLDGRRRVARAASDAIFDDANRATISLSAEPDGFVVAPANAESTSTATDTGRTDRLTFGHLRQILGGIVPKISDGFVALGIPIPASKAAVTHDEIVKLLRTAVSKAIAAAPATTTSAGTTARHTGESVPRANVTAIDAKTKSRPVGTLRDNPRVDGLDGMQRSELEQGPNAALEALFVLLHAKGLTAIPDLQAWCAANRLWPADGGFTPPNRRAIAAKLLLAIEKPEKFGTGLHESIPAPSAGVAP